jgi:hypothetical protein
MSTLRVQSTVGFLVWGKAVYYKLYVHLAGEGWAFGKHECSGGSLDAWGDASFHPPLNRMLTLILMHASAGVCQISNGARS